MLCIQQSIKEAETLTPKEDIFSERSQDDEVSLSICHVSVECYMVIV